MSQLAMNIKHLLENYVFYPAILLSSMSGIAYT